MRRQITATFLLAVLVAVGCSGDDDAASTSARRSTTSTVTAPPMSKLFGTDQALAIAHAGGERDYPKETLFAFGEAVRSGVDVLEFDVHLSKDGQVVLNHDDTVDATTDGHGKVADMTAAELAKLDAAYRFGEPDFPYRGVRTGDKPAPKGYEPADFGVTTLRKVARRFPGVDLDIEIKPEGAAGVATAKALAKELQELDRTGTAVVVSFDQDIIEAFRKAAPEVAVSPGTDGVTDWYLKKSKLDGYSVLQVPPTYSGVEVVTPETVARAHADGLDVWVWMNEAPQETEAFYRKLLAMDVDGIISDHPKLIASLVAR